MSSFKFSYIEMQFPTLSTPLTRAAELKFSHARYEHETAVVYFTDWSPTYESVTPGTPVLVRLRGGKSVEDYNMYVNYVKPDLSPSKKYLEMHLIGASFPFKQQSQKMWSNVTADVVVADIAKKHSFSYKAVPHSRVYEQITQAGKTDWELLVSLAKQSGYSVIATNASLSFEPITMSFSEKQANAHYFTMSDLSSRYTSMYSFTPIIGEATPFEDAQKAAVSISGVNPKNKTSHAHKGAKQSKYTRAKSAQPAFTAYNTSVVAPSFEVSKYETDAAVERNRHPYRGTAVVLGTPGIRPGDPVYLNGIGNSYSGFWTVLKVEHEIENNIEFTTTLHVGTDSLGISESWDGTPPVFSPNEQRTRVLGPQNAGKNSVPSTYLTASGRGSKANQTKHFSLASGESTKATTASVYKWESTPVSLTRTTKKEKTMPWVVREKKLSKNG